MSDEELAQAYLQALAQGNAQLAAQLRDQLWQQVNERVRRLARRSARFGVHALEDLVQEAWVRYDAVLRRWNPTHGGAPAALWPWLNRVLTNRFNDLYPPRPQPQAGIAEGQVVDTGERDRRRSHFRIVFQSLRAQATDTDRIRRIDCTEQHWLDDVPVANLAQQHGVPLGRVYSWLRAIEPDFGRELLRLYPEYGQGQAP